MNGAGGMGPRAAAVFVGLGVVLVGAALAMAAGRLSPVYGLAAVFASGALVLWRGFVAQRDLETARQQAALTDRAFPASESVVSSLDVKHVLQMAAEAGTRLSWHAGAALVYLVDESKLTLRATFGLDPAPDASVRFPVLDPHTTQAVRTRRAVIGALAGSPGGQTDLESYRSACILPLHGKGGLAGVLVLLSAKGAGAFKREQPILEYFASQAAMGIDNARLYEKVHDLFLSAIKALAAAIDAKDAYTHGHSENIAELVSMVARELKLPPHEEDNVKLAGLLHDVGKIGIPDAILRKPGRLDASERAVMMSHATLGASIIDKPGPLRDLVGIVRHHHERYDGRGYPDGLRGNDIPIGASILAVADAFDAITSHRAYHNAQPVDAALEELRRNAGGQFHPDVVEALVRVIDRERAARSQWFQQLERRMEDQAGGQAQLAAPPSQAPASEVELALRLVQDLRHIAELPMLLDRLAVSAPAALGVEEFAVLLMDERGQTLTVEAAAGVNIRPGTVIPRGRSPVWRAIEHGAAHRSEDGTIIAAPLVNGGTAFGALQAGGSSLGNGQLRMLAVAADAVAPVIQAARLRKSALTEEVRDTLTGLPNRQAILERLKEEANRYQRHGTPFALALGSVKDLPQFNSSYGFGVGDELIKRIGEMLRENVRASDVVGRIAGGTFAVLMQEVDGADAHQGVQRLQALFVDRHLPAKGRFVEPPAITWVQVRCPQDGRDPDTLLALAEHRLLRRLAD